MTSLESVTYLGGVARSGTSWVGQVFNSAPEVCFRFQPLFAYEFKGRVSEDSDGAAYEQLFRDMLPASTPFLTQADKLASGEYPRFIKNVPPQHLVFKENRYQSMIEPMLRRVPFLKAIGIIRHPCAVLNSWRKNPTEFPPGSDILAEWRFGNCKNKGNEDYFGYYKWKEVANLYLDLQQQYPTRFRVLRYEDAVADPTGVFADFFRFVGIPYGEQTRQFLARSRREHSDSYYSVFKDSSVVDKWRAELDPHIISEVAADVCGTRLEKFAQ
jgi:hypothetical protein